LPRIAMFKPLMICFANVYAGKRVGARWYWLFYAAKVQKMKNALERTRSTK